MQTNAFTFSNSDLWLIRPETALNNPNESYFTFYPSGEFEWSAMNVLCEKKSKANGYHIKIGTWGCLWISHQVSSNAESFIFQHLVIIPFLGMQDEHFVTNLGDYGFLSMDLNGTVSPKQLKTEDIL